MFDTERLTLPNIALCFFLLTLTIMPEAQGWPDNLEGELSGDVYKSTSLSIKCTFDSEVIKSPSFFITDTFADDFESLTFGYDSQDQYLTWMLRKQKIGIDISESQSELGFSVVPETYIKNYYGENNPYAAEEVFNIKKIAFGMAGTLGFIDVKFDGAKQMHAYWLGANDAWLYTVQFLPALASDEESILDIKDARAGLFKALEHCKLN